MKLIFKTFVLLFFLNNCQTSVKAQSVENTAHEVLVRTIGKENASKFELKFLDVLNKSYPVETSGALKNYSFEYESKISNCNWQKSQAITGQTRINFSNISELNLNSRHFID